MKAGVWVLLVWSGQGVLFGQGIGQTLGSSYPRQPQQDGWRLYSVSGNASYYSVGLPYGYGSLPAGTPQQPAFGGGGALAAGWTEVRENFSATVSYGASYTTQSGYTGSRALNQSLLLGWQRKLRGRWSFGLNARGGIATRDQYLYASTSPAAGIPAAGSENLVEEALAQVLFGSRVFTSQLTSGLTYHHSERLSWNFTLSGSWIKNLPDATNREQPGSLIAGSTAMTAEVRLQYLLSPRTTVSVAVSESRTLSPIEYAYTTRAIAGISRALSRRWLGEVHAGGSQISPLRQTYLLPANFGYVAGGSLRFKTYSHTLLGLVSRQLGDAYGLGAASSLTGSGAWIWRRPGNAWSAQGIFSWQKLNHGLSVEDWSLTGAVNRAFGRFFATQIAYVYLQFSRSPVSGVLPAQSSVRVSVTWYPGRPIYR